VWCSLVGCIYRTRIGAFRLNNYKANNQCITLDCSRRDVESDVEVGLWIRSFSVIILIKLTGIVLQHLHKRDSSPCGNVAVHNTNMKVLVIPSSHQLSFRFDESQFSCAYVHETFHENRASI
jgi:hypothetical protein